MPRTISLPVYGEDRTKLVQYAREVLPKDEPLQRRVSDWEQFTAYVIDLLEGKALSVDELEASGVGRHVEKKAWSILHHYRTSKAEREYRLINRGPMGVSTRRGTNPIAFEEGWDPRRE